MSLNINILPTDSDPFGVSYKEWTVRWWQWLSSIPKNRNPALDYNGRDINTNQNYPSVLFLCQTYEKAERRPFRKNRINKGRFIFMPIINYISIIDVDGNTNDEILMTAKDKMDVIGPLEININGVKFQTGFEKFRIQSPFFEINVPVNNIFNISAGIKRCISDGYWIFFGPIFENLRLSSFSSCSSGITTIEVDYELLIND